MGWLIDTNVLSELRKGTRTDPAVSTWLDGTSDTDLYTSVLVLGELRRGIESIRRRDGVAAAALELWLTRTMEVFADRIIPIDAEITVRWGRLNVPDPVPTIDGLLAATALERNLVLVTRNTRDVESTGVRCLNPFESRR